MNSVLENYIKKATKQVLNEMMHEDIEKVSAAIPQFKHSDRAFVPGDKVYIERRANKAVTYPSYTIVDVSGNDLTMTDSKGAKVKATVQLDALRTTDTWLRAFNLFSNEGENGLLPNMVFFDYEDINGEMYVTMMIKSGASWANGSKVGYKYSDLKGGGKPEYIRLAVESERDKVEMYCREGSPMPFKSKTFQSNAIRIDPKWVAFEKVGKFRGWVYGRRQSIVEACPWLRDMPAKWCDSKGTVRNIAISKYL